MKKIYLQKKITPAAACFSSILFLLSGCKGGFNSVYKIYYTKADGTGLTTVSYKSGTSDKEALLKELLSQMDVSGKSDKQVVIKPADVQVEDLAYSDGKVSVYYSANYADMDSVTEAMYRTGVVKTLSQVEDVESISFLIEKEIISLSDGQLLADMHSYDYIDDTNDEFSYAKWMQVGLYYANKEGTSLIRSSLNIAYNQNESLEKMIVSRLIEGPTENDLYPCLPENTGLLGVSVSNGICYVNFDSEFLTGLVNVTGDIPIYSVVNSLCELDNVNKVHIMINGKSDVSFHEGTSLNNDFSYNNSYVTNP